MEVSSTPPSPEEKKQYQKEYRESTELFEKSFKQHMEAKEPHKKAMFDDVMHRSLQVMNDSASSMVNKELQAMNDKLEKDLENYEKNPSKENISEVQNDIDQIESQFKNSEE